VGEWVDLKKWKRREHYLWFRGYEQPFFSVTVAVDVTRLWAWCHTDGAPSFFLTSLYLMLRAANDVEAFRLRLRPRGVWRHERVAVGPIVMRPDETFGFARIEAERSLNRFVARGEAAIRRAQSQKTLGPVTAADDVVYHSVLPWLSFTSFTNALPGRDSVPRIVFGRCAPEGNGMRMPVAVEVHHALADGLDIARFFDRFNAGLESVRVSRRRRNSSR
jgi:chloramphenicol O-acetyltransferase type A